MGFAIAGAVIAAGAATSYIGSQQSAEAAANAANQQMGQAQQNAANAMRLSAASPQELGALGQTYDTAMQRLNQQHQLMNSIDPSLMEASKQILQIMRGGSGGPASDMYNSQRQQLISHLRDQYGPGGELTSVGRQALNQFDMQMKSGELGQLQSVLGTGQSMESGLQGSVNSLNGVAQQYGNIQMRQANAAMNSGTQLLQTAGAGSVGDALKGQGLASLGNNFMQVGGMGMGYMTGGRNSFGSNGMGGMGGSQEGVGYGSNGAANNFWSSPGGGGGAFGYQPMSAPGNSYMGYNLGR